jgi:hypothetical protein
MYWSVDEAFQQYLISWSCHESIRVRVGLRETHPPYTDNSDHYSRNA